MPYEEEVHTVRNVGNLRQVITTLPPLIDDPVQEPPTSPSHLHAQTFQHTQRTVDSLTAHVHDYMALAQSSAVNACHTLQQQVTTFQLDAGACNSTTTHDDMFSDGSSNSSITDNTPALSPYDAIFDRWHHTTTPTHMQQLRDLIMTSVFLQRLWCKFTAPTCW